MVKRSHRMVIFALLSGVVVVSVFSNDRGGSRSMADVQGKTTARVSASNVAVQYSNRDSMALVVSASQLSVGVESWDGTSYNRLQLDGATSYGQVGAPDVPVLRRLVAIPECDSIRISVTERTSSIIEHIEVRPLPRTEVDPADPTRERTMFVKDDNVYSGNRAFPGSVARVEQIGYLRGQRVALVGIYPVQFNPVQDEVRLVEDFDVVFEYANPEGEVIADVGPMQNIVSKSLLNYQQSGGSALNSASDNGIMCTASGSVCWCQSQPDNWRQAAQYIINNCAADYLMIVAGELLSDATDRALVQTLAQRRADYNGFNVAVVSMDQIEATPNITATPDSIWWFVKQIYDSHSAAHMTDRLLGYLLLLGDAYNPQEQVLIPSKYLDPNHVTSDDSAAEGFYSTVSESTPLLAWNDLLPDIFVGRLPIDADPNNWELTNVVTKIVTYEPLPESQSWPDRMLFVSGGSDKHFTFEGQGASGFGAFFDSIRDDYIPSGKTVDQLHRLSGGTDASFSELVADTISSGYWVAGLFDHGMTFYLMNSFFPSHYDTLQNAPKYPLVFCTGCYTGFFDLTKTITNTWPTANGTCCTSPIFPDTNLSCHSPRTPIDSCDVLAERLIVQSEGAIGVVAYSRQNAAPDAQHAFASTYEALFQCNAQSLGELLVATKLLSPADPITRRGLTLFGDPALDVFRRFDSQQADSVDLAITPSGIRFQNLIKNYASSKTSVSVEITVSNTWKHDALGFVVETWDGPPGVTGSVLLDSTYVDTLAAYDEMKYSKNLGNFAVGEHDIYVDVDAEEQLAEATRANNLAYRELKVFAYQPGFPVNLGLSAQCYLTLVDADQSPGYPGGEIILNTPPYYKCYSNSGELLWSSGGGGSSTPCVGNLYKDGNPKMIIPGSYFMGGQWLVIVDGTDGTPSLFLMESVTLGDSYSDDQFAAMIGWGVHDSLDVIVVARQIPNYSLRCYRPDGTLEWTRGIGTMGDLQRFAMGVADLDGDGPAEVVFVKSSITHGDSLGVVNSLGGRPWTVSVADGSGPPVSVVLADMNGDGYIEILTNGVEEGTPPQGYVYLFDRWGTRQWRTAIPEAPSLFRPFLVVSDVDGDGSRDVVVASGPTIMIIDSSGMVADSATVESNVGIGAAPLVSDIDGDGTAEIVVHYTNEDQLPYHTKHISLAVLDHELNPEGPPYSFPTNDDSSTHLGLPALGDIDHDGAVELAFATSDSVLHVIEIESGAGEDQWPQRFHNPMQTNLVEQPVVGTHAGPTTLCNDVKILGDATFETYLYVDATARVKVSASDATHSGTDSTRCELVANGPVRMIGSAASPVSFFADSMDPGDSAWVGVVVDSASNSALLKYVTISDALTGIENHAPVHLENSSILNCRTGVEAVSSVEATTCRIDAEMGVSSGADLDLRGSYVTGTYSAVNVDGGNVILEDDTLSSSLTAGISLNVEDIEDSLVCANSWIEGGGYGIYVDTLDAEVRVRSIRVTGAEIAGVYLADSCTATLDGCTLTGNTVGIEVYHNRNATVRNSTIDDNSPDGIYAHVNSDVSIEGNSIRNNTVGVHCVESSSGTISDGNVIESNSAGIKCDDDANPIIRSNRIASNAVGIVALNDATPDVGRSCEEEECDAATCADQGGNKIIDNTNHHIANLSLFVTIPAQCNYWGSRGPLPSKFSGDVAYLPYLDEDPLPELVEGPPDVPGTPEEKQDFPTAYGISQNYPNPFNPRTTIAFDVPPPGDNVQIVIYDVAGRVVRVLVNEQKSPGRYTVVWDGANRRGESVASGVYFLRMAAGRYRATQKLLVLK